MLEWGATFIQSCPALMHNSMDDAEAAAVFSKHVRHMMPPGDQNLSLLLGHLSGARCAAQLHACHDCPAGRGEASRQVQQSASSCMQYVAWSVMT